jgi:hypothetical protein
MDNSKSHSLRDGLRKHLQCVARAEESAAAAHKAFDRNRDQVEHAEALLHEAHEALDDYDRKEAANQAWPPRIPSPKERDTRRTLEETLASRSRALAVVKQKADVARLPAEAASAEVGRLAAASMPLAVAILAEEGEAALAKLVATRAEAVRAEATVRSIAGALVQRKSFREAEGINMAVNAMRWPELSVDAGRYLDLLDRLVTDSDAEAA